MDVKIVTLIHLAPEQVRKHVHLNEGSYQDYATVTRLIVDYVEQNVGLERPAVTSAPMDLSTLQNRLLALEKGKGKGKPKGNKGK
eukprot:1046973-Amphidinium_carterae.1